MIFDADNIYQSEDNRIILIKKVGEQLFEVVFKYIPNARENYLLSARGTNEKKLRSEMKRYKVVR